MYGNSSQAELACLGTSPVHFHLLFDLNSLGRASFGGSCDTIVLSSGPVKQKMNHKLTQPTNKDVWFEFSESSSFLRETIIYFSVITCSGIFTVQQHLAFQTIQFTMVNLTTGFVLLPGANVCCFFFASNALGYSLAQESCRLMLVHPIRMLYCIGDYSHHTSGNSYSFCIWSSKQSTVPTNVSSFCNIASGILQTSFIVIPVQHVKKSARCWY